MRVSLMISLTELKVMRGYACSSLADRNQNRTAVLQAAADVFCYYSSSMCFFGVFSALEIKQFLLITRAGGVG